jgi:hypothetical protein
MNFDESFWFGLAVTILLLLTGHWLPWPTRLPRVMAYIYGVGCILAGLAVWLIPDNWQTWLGVLAYAVAGGLATLAAYAYDVWRNNAIRSQLDEHHDPGSSHRRIP